MITYGCDSLMAGFSSASVFLSSPSSALTVWVGQCPAAQCWVAILRKSLCLAMAMAINHGECLWLAVNICKF